jgi:hypothetical protein
MRLKFIIKRVSFFFISLESRKFMMNTSKSFYFILFFKGLRICNSNFFNKKKMTFLNNIQLYARNK